MNRKKTFFLIVFLGAASVFAQEAMEKAFQTQFIMAQDGEVVELPAGFYELKGSLWMDDKKNITIKGAGMDKTILSFKDQTDGAEGIKITNSENIILEDLTVQDSKGDAIKTQHVKGITFKKVKTEWTGKPNKKNGAYGLYPVQCTQVMIDQCEAIGASDAGIYVGQSEYIVVKNSRAYQNVAGIEIENSTHAEVFDNIAEENTGGILVFDLPGLVKKKGGNVRVFNNQVRNNNYKNFAPDGNMVATVPPGTGIMVLATSNVEIFNNDVTDNRTLGTSIASYYITELPIEDEAYDPYPTNIYVHDNTYSKPRKRAKINSRFGKLMFIKFKKDVPNIVFDGIMKKDYLNSDGYYKDAYKICIADNEGGTFANLDAGNGFENLNRDISPFDCKGEPLTPATQLNK